MQNWGAPAPQVDLRREVYDSFEFACRVIGELPRPGKSSRIIHGETLACDTPPRTGKERVRLGVAARMTPGKFIDFVPIPVCFFFCICCGASLFKNHINTSKSKK